MLKLERRSSHSWWWDSHNSPKHSKWLQSNLQDLDDKVKEMLRLIEEDADSFAQRAEMYYQKRPELVNLVEEFYRAYRSLAERYDHLTGEIRQNIPRALQVQYGLSCDSPKSAGVGGGRHHYSPLRRSSQMFESLLKVSCKMEDTSKEADGRGDLTEAQLVKLADEGCIEDGERNECEGGQRLNSHHSSSDGGLSSSSDSEVDNVTPFNKLQQEIDELKETNKALTESHEALQGKVKDLEERYQHKNDEADALRRDLNEKLLRLETISKQQCNELLANDVQGRELEVEILPYLEEEIDSSGDEDMRGSGEELLSVVTDFSCSHGLQEQLLLLREENRMQKLVIVERAEEKREAIRQLCFSMDILKNKNQRLEVVLGLLKKRLHASNAAASAAPHWRYPAWKRLFSVDNWRGGFKAGQRFAAVAL